MMGGPGGGPGGPGGMGGGPGMHGGHMGGPHHEPMMHRHHGGMYGGPRPVRPGCGCAPGCAFAFIIFLSVIGLTGFGFISILFSLIG